MNNVKYLLNILLRISCLHFCIFNIVASNTVKRSSLNTNLGLEIPKSSNSFDKENRVRYIGAVLEFEPFNKWSEEGKGYDVIRKNAKTVVEFAEKAKIYSLISKLSFQNTDIIIAPEYGIQSLSMFHNNTENFLTFTQYVPDPSLRMVVCDQEEEPVNKYEGIKILSCGARANEIYIVADLAEFVPCSKEKIDQSLPWGYKIHENCPDNGYFIHNTQVVFDREGAVIARYRKQNLYLELLFTPGPQNDKEAIFVTDFNVAFSLQTLTLFIIPSSANGIQNGFSRGLGVNLLVSGYHLPEIGHLGSGIYKGSSNDDLPLYSFEKNSGNILLVSTVETVAASSLDLPISYFVKQEKVRDYAAQSINVKVPLKDTNDLKTSNRPHKFNYEDLSQYTKVLLESSSSQNTSKSIACSQDNFCCTLNYKYSGNQTYYFLAYSGNITVGEGAYAFEMQTCAILYCQNSDYETCSQIETDSQVSDSFPYLEISSNSFSVDAVYPIHNQRNTSLIRNDVLEFKAQNKYSSIKSLKSVDNLLTIALLGKRFF
ncbi:hypothetical protein Anas_07600 [Armadillidium nasatum]|uniref:Vanin C-terminal domain-containing protein n=1 Tax=Armadillidium nasatum TaxID=96803 RepID=A0A5N5T6E7_9CRUS|nr:hypothetical protein Anas_07600 [Armadillidium nasatum]